MEHNNSEPTQVHVLHHTHTEYSLKDSALSPELLVGRAKELGFETIILTDHGTLLGVYRFMHACEAAGVKGIPGVEAYIEEDGIAERRSHMVLIPKDYIGYRAISDAVTASNRRIDKGIPRMDTKMLKECFGEGTPGHGHVIATSACVGGILAQILLKNSYIESQIAKTEKKMAKLDSPKDPAYLANKEKLQELSKNIQEMMEKRNAMTKVSGKKYSTKEKQLRAIKAAGDEAEYEKAKAALDVEKAETEQAVKELPELKKRIAASKKQETLLRQKCAEAEKNHGKWNWEAKQLEALKAELRSENDLQTLVGKKLDELLAIFGKGNFYIELQYHGIEDEKKVMPVLADIATFCDVPVVVANDVHYAANSEDDVRARRIIRSLRFNKWEEEMPGDHEYYIKTDEELRESLREILSDDVIDRGFAGARAIANACNVVFPHELHTPAFKSPDGESGKDRLRRLAHEAIPVKYGAEWTPAHQERLEYELSVIEELGYSDYLCIVEDFLRYGRKLGTDNPEGVGLGIGSGRGSAVGSIVCYLTGITGIDPIRHNLIFERFLNRDRVSMPDIDSDFDIDIREKVVEYVKGVYGDAAVCNITTLGTLGAKYAVRAATRILGSARYGDSRALLDIGDRIARVIPNEPGVKLSDCDALAEFKSDDAKQIIDDARLIEGVAVQTGVHAAGVIIADNGDVSKYIPLMWNDEKACWCAQCDMVEAESDAGLLKMDVRIVR